MTNTTQPAAARRRRAFNANPPLGESRCVADITLRDGSSAQCMRRAKVGCYCRQHAALRGPVGCICPAGCDCQAPEIEGHVQYVSNHCPVHNLYPRPVENCPAHYGAA